MNGAWALKSMLIIYAEVTSPSSSSSCDTIRIIIREYLQRGSVQQWKSEPDLHHVAYPSSPGPAEAAANSESRAQGTC